MASRPPTLTSSRPHLISVVIAVVAVLLLMTTVTAGAAPAMAASQLGATPHQSDPIPLSPTQVAPDALVDRIYRDLLGRPADPGGLDFWATAIGSGMPPARVIEAFIQSVEVGGAYEPTVRLYRAAFLRSPDPSGLSYWVKAARGGSDFKTIAEVFATSTEFVNRYGSLTDRQFVDRIYRNVLGRAADRAGADYWVGQLQRGQDRGELLLAFSESPENARRTSVSARLSVLWITLLKRIPDNAAVEAWAGRPATTPTADLINEVIGSPAYRARLGRLFPARRPLTGQFGVAAVDRPALAVKIDNVDAGRPQIGLNRADIVYEEMVEGRLTRLIGVFHSQTPPVVGPVRSVRISDFDVLAPYNRPLLAASGANPGVLAALEGAPVVNVNALKVNEYWRDSRRRAPHNLMTSPAGLWKHAPDNAAAPPVMFSTGAIPSTGEPRPGGVAIDFGRASVRWHWDGSQRVWRRTQNGTAHVDSAGQPMGAENVIVMVVDYTANAIDAQSPEAHTIGRGRALMFVAGTWIDGWWARGAATQPIRFTTKAGSPVAFRPGQTWIELAPPGTTRLR